MGERQSYPRAVSWIEEREVRHERRRLDTVREHGQNPCVRERESVSKMVSRVTVSPSGAEVSSALATSFYFSFTRSVSLFFRVITSNKTQFRRVRVVTCYNTEAEKHGTKGIFI